MADEPMDVDSSSSGSAFDWSAPFDELDSEDPKSPSYGSRDSVLFTIDLSKRMFLPSENENECALEKSLKAIRKVIISKIFSAAQDYVGIMFYNSAKKAGTTFEYIYLYEDLQLPGADIVKKIDELMELVKEGPDQIKAKFGVSDKCSISDLLWAANLFFSKITKKLASRRVLVFTADDEPHKNDKLAATMAIQKAADVAEGGVSVVVFPIDTTGNSFALEKFWRHIEQGGAPDETPRLVGAIKQWEELENQVRKRVNTKRTMARLPLILTDGLELYVGVYNLIQTATKPTPIKLYKETNEEVISETSTMENEGGAILMETDIKKYMQFAGRKLCFTPDEIDQMTRFGQAGLKVIAFKPLTCLKLKHHIRSAQFIFPDDSLMIGSTRMFIALHKKCLEKEVMALCQYIPRENSAPKFVALTPAEEQLDELGVQLSPAGFNIIFLPFSDDFRGDLPLYREAPVANREMIEVSQKLIKALTRSYAPEDILNPALQKHYVNVEALALLYDQQELEDRTPVDLTTPNFKAMKKKAGRIMDKFMEVVFPPGYDPMAATAPKKRSGKNDGDAPQKKGPAKKEVPGDMHGQIVQAAESGTLNKLTVSILKEYCQANKINPNGTKKGDLIGAIETHLAGNN